MLKSFTTISLAVALCAIAFSSFIGSSPIGQIRLQQTFFASDTLPKPALPEGANPDDPDWKGIDLEAKAPVQPTKPKKFHGR